jgi:hypothetical protein
VNKRGAEIAILQAIGLGGDFLDEFRRGTSESRDGNDAFGDHRGDFRVVNSFGEDFYVDCGVRDYGGGNGAGDVVVAEGPLSGRHCFLAAADDPEEPVPVQDF